MRVKILAFSLLILVFFFSSCSIKQKGTFVGEVKIGINSNEIAIYYENEGNSYTFYSFQDFSNSPLKNSEKITFIESFPVNFTVSGSKIYILNRISNIVKLISLESGKSYLEGLFSLPQNLYISDFSINTKKDIFFLFMVSEADEYYLYKIGYSSLNATNEIKGISVFTNILTNAFGLESIEDGFLVFERNLDGGLTASIFSTEGRILAINLSDYVEKIRGLYASSASVLKGKKIVAKFENPTNGNITTIVVFDLAKTNLERINTIEVGNQNFSIISSINDAYVLAATYKNNSPVLLLFDPMSEFKISYEYYVDIMYPFMFRGFKATKNGKLFASYIDFPDNRIIFYYWNILSRL